MRTRGFRYQSGLTLLEMVIGMTILTIAALSFVSAMGAISKSIRMSKSTTLAANLAQEKVESLKNLSYFRLLVTTATASAVTSEGTFYYDTGYYSPEDMSVGQITFRRGVLVQKVTEAGGVLTPNNWYDADTGLKLITVHVAWQENRIWKRVSVTNLRDNSNRAKIDAKFTGTVTSGIALQDVSVVTLQDPVLKDMTTSLGKYSISVPAGTYDLRATKRGYFPAVISSTVAASGTQTVDFSLTQMNYGSVSGIVYLRNHLVISGICASVNGDDQLEYVELYNPTESTFTMHNGVSPSYQIDYIRTSDSNIATINPALTTKYVNSVLLPHHFYLFASSANVGVPADAYYSNATFTAIVPANRIPVVESGGVRLYSLGVYETASTNVDAIGWGHSGGSPYGPDLAREANGLQIPVTNGLATDETLERMVYSTSTASTMSIAPPGSHAFLGNAYDSNNNNNDWVHHNDTLNDVAKNSSSTAEAQTGTPAGGAAVSVSDGLSASTIANAAGAFTVVMVATGTWSITASSSGWVYSQEGAVSVTNGVTTNVGSIALVSSGTMGFISGRVVNSANNPLTAIAIETSGGVDTTDSNGLYHMQLNVGTYTIIANQNNSNSSYTTGITTGVIINSGRDTVAPDIILYQGGKFKGFVTANGIDPLPGVPILATQTATGLGIGSVISDSQGYFTFPDLPVGGYVIFPQLESGESTTPPSYPKTIVMGSTVWVGTFTIANAFGRLDGTVFKTSSIITTGVLIVAVPSGTSLAGNPPTIDESLRSAGTIYYAGTSEADGTYTLALRAGTYNVYGWYTTFSANTPTTTRIAQTAVITAGNSAVLNFTW